MNDGDSRGPAVILEAFATPCPGYGASLIRENLFVYPTCNLCCTFTNHRFLLPVFVVWRNHQATMKWTTMLVALTALARDATAQNNMLRFACSQLVVERTDPLVHPGMKYTPHLHQIVGGDAFNITMDPSNDLAKMSKCTSCSFVQDKSNYWTAVMFFKAKNGSYIRVPQVHSNSISSTYTETRTHLMTDG